MSNINAQTIIAEVMAAHAIAPDDGTEYITFKTSERGTHRIINDKAHLQRFADAVRKNAAAFGGGLIREAKTAPAVSYASKTISLYKQLIEDQDWHAALQLADEKLSPLFFFGTHGKAYMQVAPIPCDFEPRFVSTLNEDGKWSVCCPVSMLGLDSLIGNKRSRKAQIDAAEQHLQVIDPEKKESVFADAHTRPVDQSAARAKWMADHGIIDDAEIDARIEAQAAQDVAEVVAQAVAVSAIAEAMAPAAETESTPELVTCEAGESESNCASIAQFINVAADSVGTLRKIDVSRVMDEAPTQYRQELAAYIQYNRPDLAQEVSDVLEESTHTTTPAVISGTVTSPVAISKEYRYAMVNRPFSIGTAPTDGIIRMDARPSQGDPHHDMARHGIAVYNRQLTDKETIDYELAPIADDAMMENLCAAVTHDIAEYATEYVSMASDDWINFEAHVINTMKRVTTSFRVSIESNRAFADMVLTALTTATRAPSTPAAGTVEQPATRPVESTPEPVAPVVGTSTEWAPAIGEKYIGAVECAVAMANMRGDGMEYRVGENAIMERRIKPITLQTTKQDDYVKFNIRAKSGQWLACVYMIGTVYGLRFEAKGMEPITGEFATHAERMRAMEVMARATTPPDTPPDGGMPIEPVDAPTEALTPPVAECTPDTPPAVSRAEKPEHDLKVGDVVRSSWGYDQTNVNHYQITKLIGKRTVEVRELVEHKESTGDMSGRVAPVWGEFVGEPMRRTVDKYGHVNILREKFGRARKIEPVAVVHGVRCYASTGYSSYA